MYRHADAVEMNPFAAYALAGLAIPEDAPAAGTLRVDAQGAGPNPHRPSGLPIGARHGPQPGSAAAWLLGGTVVFLEGRSFDAHELWRTVEREGVTQIGIVGDAFAGPMVEALEEAEADGRPYDLSSVERVLSSGAPWALRLKQGLAARGSMTLVETIGASEGGPTAVAVVPPGTRAEDARFVLGERARLLGEDGTAIATGIDRARPVGDDAPDPVRVLQRPRPLSPGLSPDRWSAVFDLR